ncbi:hypothetical protein IID19_05160 [Patescibacteria group bacterium]|nr:hypothetical protein [Patescibacteria group bacterium]
MGKNKRKKKGCNLDSWIKQLFRNDSEKRARRLANYVFDNELTPGQRDEALRTVIRTISRNYPHDGSDAWLRNIRMLACQFTDRGLALPDATFINGVYTVITDAELLPYDVVRMYLLVGFFEYIGSNVTRTKHFCRVMFEDFAEQMATVLCRGRQAMQEFTSEQTPLFVSIIWESSHCPASEEFPYKKWINNLIEASCQGDKDVDAWLDGIFYILQLQKSHIEIITQSAFKAGLKRRRKTVSDYTGQLFDPLRPLMIVPDELKAPLEIFLQTTSKKKEDINSEAVEWAMWFNMNRQEILRGIVSKRDDIMLRPTCGVRKDGYDNVRVSDLSIMKYLGVESIAFYPNGGTFPDMDIAFTVTRFGCLTYQIRGSLEQMTLFVGQVLYEVCSDDMQELLHVITELVIIDVMHRIVVSSYGDHGLSVSSSEVNGVKYRKDVPIRPHFPLLREGAKASVGAIELCLQEMGCRPPKSRTYNSGHSPTDEFIEVPMTPRFILTNEVLISDYQSAQEEN